ncbi:hypothetical protein EV121DRAFT_298174 [Schizophyllum commune]
MAPVKVEVVEGDISHSDDESQYGSLDDLILAFNWHDLAPPPGYCLPPFLAETHHKHPHADVRDDPAFKPYYVVLSCPRYAGGVYTNFDSMKFAMQGYDRKPPWKMRDTWEDGSVSHGVNTITSDKASYSS